MKIIKMKISGGNYCEDDVEVKCLSKTTNGSHRELEPDIDMPRGCCTIYINIHGEKTILAAKLT